MCVGGGGGGRGGWNHIHAPKVLKVDGYTLREVVHSCLYLLPSSRGVYSLKGKNLLLLE